MLGRLKKILGIEGVKLTLSVDGPLDLSSDNISGSLKFTTKTTGTITSISVKIIEKYSRGRKKNKLTDEYTIGEIRLNDGFQITPEEIVEIPFELPFHAVKSPMDIWGEKNPVTRGMTFLAKKMKGVKSEFRVVAEAEVEGTGLNPFDTKVVSPA